MKSPLKDKPLRNPGETLLKEIEDYKYDHVLAPTMGATFVVILAVLEWGYWYMETPRSPWPFTVMAVAAVIYAFFKTRKSIKHIRRLRQGHHGEVAVGQYLELLRESGARVFHDVPGKGFNLDHVVIAPSGIYVIETKTYSKPDKGEPTIVFDGDQIELKGYTTKEPVIQVKAAASWLKSLLKESTGQDFLVKPVVVFPGWYVQPTAEAKSSEVWVLNPKALPAFIERSKNQLVPDKLSMAAFHLSRYVRDFKTG